MLGVAERSRLGVVLLLVLADVGVGEDGQPLGVGRHDPVFNPIVDHLDEVPGAAGSAMEVAVLGGGGLAIAAGRPVRRVDGRGERGEDRVEVLHRAVLAADHHAITPVDPPDAAAGPDVDVVNALALKLLGAVQVVDVIRVATVDDDVARLQERAELGQRLVDDGGGDHQPDGPRLRQLLDEILERSRALGSLRDERVDGLGVRVEHDALMAALHQAADHVRAHSSQTDHAELHRESSPWLERLQSIERFQSSDAAGLPASSRAATEDGCPARRVGSAEVGIESLPVQRMNPPVKALALSPGRAPEGSSSSFLTLPPPMTMSVGSNAFARPSTTFET
jgi:hypothetical protein